MRSFQAFRHSEVVSGGFRSTDHVTGSLGQHSENSTQCDQYNQKSLCLTDTAPCNRSFIYKAATVIFCVAKQSGSHQVLGESRWPDGAGDAVYQEAEHSDSIVASE